MLRKLISVLALAALLLTSCGGEGETPAETTAPSRDEGGTVSASQMSDDIVTVTADFGVELFSVLSRETENCLISPLSVSFALGMTEMGASGETLDEMAQVLGGNMEPAQYLGELLALRDSYEDTDSLSIANGVWYKEGELSPYERFVRACEEGFRAPIVAAPFDSTTVDEINGWVKEHTDGKIDGIIDRIDKDAVMCLVNALSFSGKWAVPCEEYDITPYFFQNRDGQRTEVDGMRFIEGIYLTDGDAVGFMKPYEDSRFAFAALLPEEGTDIHDYIDSLTGERLTDTLSSAEATEVEVLMPRFRAEYRGELKDALMSMGMELPFDEFEADFSDFGETLDPIYISSVIHKTFIEVSETGTEAAAATAVIVCKSSAADPLDDTNEVILDRPFVYMIVDTETGLPVFMGAMENME